MAFVLKSISSDIGIVTPDFFFHICLLGIFFSPSLHCRPVYSFVLWWVSCRQFICSLCFLIHSAIICLLIGEFKPFKCKVIIDRYLSLPFSPLCLCSPLPFSLFLHLLKIVPLSSLATLLWWRCILLAFFCLFGKVFILSTTLFIHF